MKTKLIALFSLLFLFGIIMISCDEQSLLPDTPDTQSVEDNAAAETGVARVFENVNNYGISEEGKKSMMNGAPDSIYWDADHKTVTMIFGEGSIVAAFNATPQPLQPIALSADVTVANYDVDGTKMDGSFTLAFDPNLLDQEHGPTFDIVTTEDIVFTGDTASSSWGGNRHIEWSEGWNPLDTVNTTQVFLFSGESHGTNIEGNSFETVISADHPLRRSSDCEYISEGIMTITEAATEAGGDPTVMEIDFGDGTCDSEMIVTINGIEITVNQ